MQKGRRSGADLINYRPQRSCKGYVFTGVCLSTGGGSAPRGGSAWSQGAVCLVQGVVSASWGVPGTRGSALEGCLVPGGGLYLVRVGSAWSGGVGVPGPGVLVSQHALR